MDVNDVKAIEKRKEKRALAFAVDTVDRVIAFSAASVAIFALLVLFLSLGAGVAIRYFTTQGLGWPMELPKLLFPWVVMGGIVLAAQRGSHVSVNVVLQALNKRRARMLTMVIQGVVAMAFFFLFYIGLEVVACTGSEVYPMTGVQAKWAYLSLIAGFFGIGLTAVTTLCRLSMSAVSHAVTATNQGQEKP